MRSRILGVGINDADYQTCITEKVVDSTGRMRNKTVWICPIYSIWLNMIKRCYSEKSKRKGKTYVGCTVIEEWLLFSNFKAWVEQQNWEGKQLDKDILFPGNKIYSPETCVFVDQRVNNFILENQAKRKFSIGVTWHKRANRFLSQCKQLGGGNKYLGLFETEEAAHKAWLKEKLRLAYILAEQQDDPRVAKALIDRYENYREYNK